jgi:predicted transglutaminase-like cysteine proteinase
MLSAKLSVMRPLGPRRRAKRAVVSSLALLCAVSLALGTPQMSRADVEGPAVRGQALQTSSAVHAAHISDTQDHDQPIRLASLDVSAADVNSRAKPAREPFGVLTASAAEERLTAKWKGVRRDMASEADLLARCAVDATCPSVGATRFLAIVAAAKSRTGRARLGEVNRAVNLALRPMSDLAQYGVVDHWAPPLEALTRGAGDCEDYAIAKYAALRAAGISEEDLRLVVVHDNKLREDHAVLAARLDGAWLVLDNRRLLMLPDAELPNYVPLFTLGADGIRRVDGYALAEAVSARRN